MVTKYNKYISWEIVAYALAVIVISIAGYHYSSFSSEVKADIKTVQQQKMDRAEFERSWQTYMDRHKGMEDKIDYIYNWIINHEKRR